jgi:cell division protease FtsH
VSDVTVHNIDEEVRTIIDRNYQRAKSILTEHEDKLKSMAQALMKYETIDAEQIKNIMEGRDPGEPKDWNNSDDTESSAGKAGGAEDASTPIGGPASEH